MKEAGFRHDALIYAGAEDFLSATAPFLREALGAGEAALVAVSQANRALLEGELGADAAEIRFAEMERLGRNPARIIPLWREFLDVNPGRPVRGIGEPVWPGREPAEIDECERHESLLNVAFSSSPAFALLCPYDARAFGDELLEKVAHSHRAVARGGVDSPSDEYLISRDCFAGSLSSRPAGAEAFEFDRPKLGEVRRRVERAAARAGLSASEAADLVIAASEVAANSIAYGGGAGTLGIWLEESRLLVEFEDTGTIEEPLAGRLRPRPTQEGGRGLWLANQLCDLVQVRSAPGRTTIRLHASRR
ncbi:MAG TPA: anti-sigma factor RsbA family regulatory protein [Solirubrobacterales bacterium]|jgi:anti-sigma regulatory factor (Ser/Thr protein kinase)